MRIFTAAGGRRVRRAAWRRPLDVTNLGAFGPKVLLLGASAQNTPPGCICGVLDYKAEAFYFLFLSQKESSKEKCSLRIKVFRPLRRATRDAVPGLCRPLKRAALNFRPFVTQWLSWVLPGVLTVFCPKRKIAPRNLARGVTTSRLLLHPTPGTTQASVQPLGAERRGGSGPAAQKVAGPGPIFVWRRI